jgi:hypothetical protein
MTNSTALPRDRCILILSYHLTSVSSHQANLLKISIIFIPFFFYIFCFINCRLVHCLLRGAAATAALFTVSDIGTTAQSMHENDCLQRKWDSSEKIYCNTDLLFAERHRRPHLELAHCKSLVYLVEGALHTKLGYILNITC